MEGNGVNKMRNITYFTPFHFTVELRKEKDILLVAVLNGNNHIVRGDRFCFLCSVHSGGYDGTTAKIQFYYLLGL